MKCKYCGSHLKSRIGGVSACPKCGRTQPWADPKVKAQRLAKQSGIKLLDSERVLAVDKVKKGSQRGTLVLTNFRLYFRRGIAFAGFSASGDAATIRLEDVVTVVRLTDTPGFGVDVRAGERIIFVVPPNRDWYDKVLSAANTQMIKQMRMR